MLKLIKQTELSIIDWSSFVENHPNGNIFQTPDFYELNSFSEGISPFVFGVEDDLQLVALVAGLILYNGRILKSLTSRAIITGGPLIIPCEPKLSEDILLFLLDNLNSELKGKVIYTEYRNLWDWSENRRIYSDQGFKFEEHLNIQIDLRTPEDILWSNISRDRKKSIKKGMNLLRIEEIETRTELHHEIYLLLKKVYRRIKLPLPGESYFYKIFREFSARNYIKIFGAFKDDILIGVRVVLCYKQNIYDWYAGAEDSLLICRPNDILPWAAIRWGIAQNFNLFDFGGAGKPGVPYGVRDYKLKFGGHLVNFGRFTSINKKALFRIGILGLKFYKLIR